MEEEEEDDDIYAPDEAVEAVEVVGQVPTASDGTKKKGDDLEEGEEEGEELEGDSTSDSDIDIITERTEEPKVETLQSRVNTIKNAPSRTSSSEAIVKVQSSPTVTAENTAKPQLSRSGASYPAIKSSSIDVDAKPLYEPNDKPITEINLDTDFPEDDKLWRRPGTDMTDYFNYGFDEFTWASYCLKQDSLRKEILDSKKQMEEMQNFLGMPGGMPSLPGIAGQPGGAPANMATLGGPADMPPEVQQMMAQMMAQGVDLSQMDPTMFMSQMMQGSQAGANGAQGQNFVAQGFGQQGQNQQQVNFGYGGGGGGGTGGGASAANAVGGGGGAGAGAGAGGGGGGGGSGGGRNQGGRGQNRRNW